MNIILKKQIILTIIFIFLSTDIVFSNIFNEKNDRLQSSKFMTKYLYGTILNKRNDFLNSQKYLSGLEDLKKEHELFNLQYVIALTVNGDIKKASRYINDFDGELKFRFPYNLVLFTQFIKEKKFDEAINTINKNSKIDPLYDELIFSLKRWTIIKSNLTKEFDHKPLSKQVDLINNYLISGYLNNKKDMLFYEKKIIQDKSLHRYHALIAINKISNSKNKQAEDILKYSLENNRNSILLKQLNINIQNYKNKNNFTNFYDKNKFQDNLAEILYLFAGFYFDRGEDQVSQILLSLSNYLNPKFLSNYLLLFEHDLKNNNQEVNQKIINILTNIGEEYNWYINYQLLLDNKKKPFELISILKENKHYIYEKNIDIANFYRYKKKYKKALKYYQIAENSINDSNLPWEFYYYKGICFERLDKWNKAEKNFLKSLQISSNQFRVINYLAYSWLERGKNLDKAKKMLYKANELSEWKYGYVIDSLGWAYFLNKNYQMAEKYLKLAYEKAPYEVEVYDHYGDVLWKLNKKLQARYVWKNALKLNSIEKKLKKSIEKKIVDGL